MSSLSATKVYKGNNKITELRTDTISQQPENCEKL